MCEKCSLASSGKTSNNELNNLLTYARENYGKHTEWFLRHKDMGLKSLAVVLTGEITITSFCLSDKFPDIITIVTLLILSFLSVIITFYGIINCKASYKASLENAILCTKTIWAMGLAKPIEIDAQNVDFTNCPVREDNTPYIPRFLDDAAKQPTTDKFIEYHLSRRGTTYFTAKWTIICFGVVGLCTGLGSALMIYTNIPKS
jgi:hypothetical protein